MATMATTMGRLFVLGLGLGCAGFAQAELKAPPLDAQGRAGFTEFQHAEKHRAFAIAPGGAWSWRGEMPTPELAMQAALTDCRSQARRPCQAYALDDKLVFDAQAWAQTWRPYLTAAQAKQAPLGVKPGQRFPDLVYREAGGRERKLSDQRGHVVLLHFWGSWCPPCQREMPDLHQLYARLKATSNLRFIFLPVREPAAASRAWLRKQGIALPLADAGAQAAKTGVFKLAGGDSLRDRDVAKAFPTTYILDRNGIVLFAQIGPVSHWPALEPMLQDAVGAAKGKPRR